MTIVHRWIILLLVWNLGLLVAGGAILAVKMLDVPQAESVAAICADQVADALQDLQSTDE